MGALGLGSASAFQKGLFAEIHTLRAPLPRETIPEQVHRRCVPPASEVPEAVLQLVSLDADLSVPDHNVMTSQWARDACGAVFRPQPQWSCPEPRHWSPGCLQGRVQAAASAGLSRASSPVPRLSSHPRLLASCIIQRIAFFPGLAASPGCPLTHHPLTPLLDSSLEAHFSHSVQRPRPSLAASPASRLLQGRMVPFEGSSCNPVAPAIKKKTAPCPHQLPT